MERRVTVRGIITNSKNEVLAVRHKRQDGSAAEYWAIPGGGLDPMESIHDGAKRELIEELGIEAELGRILVVQQFADLERTNHKNEYLEFFFEVTNSQDFINATTSGTSHGEIESSELSFVNPKEVTILPTILSTDDFIGVLKGTVATPLVHTEI